MNSTQKPSSRTVWIIAVAAVVALLLIVGVVAMLAARQPADQTTLPAASDQSASTKSDIKQNLSDLDKSIKHGNGCFSSFVLNGSRLRRQRRS